MQFTQEQGRQLCHGEDSHCRGVKNTGLISMKRLESGGHPGAGFVNQCGGRGDVWKAVCNRRLTLNVTQRVRGRESERNYGWALNWEGLEGKKRIRSSQERKKRMSIFKDVSCVHNRKYSGIWPQNLRLLNVTEYFQKAKFVIFVPFNNRWKEGKVYCLIFFHLCEVCWFGLG